MRLINPPQRTTCVFCGIELVVNVEYYRTWSNALFAEHNGKPVVGNSSGYQPLGSQSELQWNLIDGQFAPANAEEAYIHQLYCPDCRLRYEP